MKLKKNSLKGLLLSIVMLSGLFIQSIPVSAIRANDYDGLSLPSFVDTSSTEYGIWLDRGRIYLLNATLSVGDIENAEASDASLFEAPELLGEERGLNDGTITYTNSGGKTLTVTFNSYGDTPSTATMGSVTVQLLKTDNAKYDGYYYDYDDPGEGGTIEMFRYVESVTGAGALECTDGASFSAANVNAQIGINATYEWNEGEDRWDETPANDYNYVHDYSDVSSDYARARQTRDVKNKNDDCNKSYGGDGKVRDVFLAKGVSRDQSETDLQSVINEWLSARARYADFVEFFQNASYATKLRECINETTVGTSAEEAIQLLAKKEPGPFFECMKEKFSDPRVDRFFEILDKQVVGDYTVPVSESDGDGDCGIDIFIIGDIICGVIKFIFNGISSMFTNIIDFFGNTSDTFTSIANDPNSNALEAWSNIRSVANLIFLIAFLMVIFQYLTNINVVDAYFIKKFIPRMLIAVVLVQASWWIVGEANYLFTELGQSVQSLVLYGGGASGDTVEITTGAGAVAGLTAAGVGLFALGPVGAAIILVLALILLLVLIITIIILTIRELLLFTLALLAPIAFACMAIPQLEGIAKKWFKTYLQLLLMYPIIQLTLAIGIILGNILSDMNNIIYQIIGFIAYFLPFFILPFTFKFAGGLMGNVAGKLQSAAMNKGKKAYGNSQFGMKRAQMKEDKMGIRKDRARRDARKDLSSQMNEGVGKNRRERMRKRLGRPGIYGAWADDETRGRVQSQYQAGVRKQDLDDAKGRFEDSQHDVSASVLTDSTGAPLENKDGVVYGAAGTSVDTDDVYKRIARGETVNVKGSDGVTRTIGGNAADQEMAMNQLASFGRDKVIRELSDGSNPENAKVDGAALQRSINANAGALSGKAPDIVKGATSAFDGGISAESISGFSDGTVKEAFKHVFRPGASKSEQQALINEAHKMVQSDKLLDGTSKGTAQALYDELSTRGLLSSSAGDALKKKIGK